MRLLLDRGADVCGTGNLNKQKSGILSDAVRSGDVKIVKLLLDRGVDINGHNYFLYSPTALKLAAGVAGRTAIAKLLMDRGAKIRGGELEAAMLSENVEVADLLVDRGAVRDKAGGQRFNSYLVTRGFPVCYQLFIS